MEKVKTRIQRMERQIADQRQTATKQVADQKALTNVKSFCETVLANRPAKHILAN